VAADVKEPSSTTSAKSAMVVRSSRASMAIVVRDGTERCSRGS
jgi:hypothetical protein